jgi:PAS domain S-box-containing protein
MHVPKVTCARIGADPGIPAASSSSPTLPVFGIKARKAALLLKMLALQRSILNSLELSAIATDEDGLIQIFNLGAERMLGYTAAEVTNQLTLAQLADPAELIARAQVLSLELGRAIAPGFEALAFKASQCTEDVYELSYVRKDRTRLQARVAVTSLRDPPGSILGYLLINKEIPREKPAEATLLELGALHRAIFNSANFSSIATDARGVIQIFNVGAEQMLGYSASEVINKVTPADMSDPAEVVARARALSVEFSTPIAPGFEALVFKASRTIEDIYELTYVRKNGSRFPAVVSVTALRDEPGAIIGYLLIGTDNTARKQVEEERSKLDQRLRDQQFYTRSLIESNIDALMTTDPRGIITDVNKQTEALTGCTRDELIGAPFKNYFTDPERAQAGISRVLLDGKITNYELTARAWGGHLTVVSYNATTFHDRDRNLQGVFAAARDVTELKRFEETLQQKNAELQNASRMKSEFLANMSHELRTPLNAIIGFSEVLRDGLVGKVTAPQRGFISDIYGSGTHLLSLINDILELSKIEAGNLALDLEPVSVASLFMNSLSIIREKAAARNIRLSMESPEGLGSMQADVRKIKQMVYNLLSNAVKFTADGGQVILRIARVPRSNVATLSGASAGRSLRFVDTGCAEFLAVSVTDTGIGIAPEALEQLFKPFSQIDGGLARKFEGTGLGLAMVRSLSELHGGVVAVESALGSGSRFSIWLPFRAPNDEGRLSVPPPVQSCIRALSAARTALVVQNDMQSAALIRTQLEAEGFLVIHARCAERALALAAEQPLALIALDICLPEMDGWQFLSCVRQIPTLARTPVVIVSNVADGDKRFSLGAAAVVQKPISREELSQTLLALGLFPLPQGRTLKVLVVDDDPRAVELIAVRIQGLATTVLRAYGGADAIIAARQHLPDLIVLDLMMPEVNGFDVVESLTDRADTARIPILVVTAKQITAEDRAKLSGYVSIIMANSVFDADRFTAEVRRAMAGRELVA